MAKAITPSLLLTKEQQEAMLQAKIKTFTEGYEKLVTETGIGLRPVMLKYGLELEYFVKANAPVD